MAERRMFSKSIVSSARFLRMPQSSRLLYYDLGMAADDDGIVEAFTVIRTTGAAEDDLRVLATRGFITVLNDDLVSYITDWSRNNYIQKDRYHPSIYNKLLVKLGDGFQSATDWKPSGNVTDTGCIQPVSNMDTQVRLGKDSIGKASEGEGSKAAAPPTPARRKYGTYGWVRLTDDEHAHLEHDLGAVELARCISYVDESAQGNGNKNRWKDWNLVIRRCSREGWGRNRVQDGDRNRLRTESDYSVGSGDFFGGGA